MGETDLSLTDPHRRRCGSEEVDGRPPPRMIHYRGPLDLSDHFDHLRLGEEGEVQQSLGSEGPAVYVNVISIDIIRDAGQISFKLNPSILVFKDSIMFCKNSVGKGGVFFFPQHYKKLE